MKVTSALLSANLLLLATVAALRFEKVDNPAIFKIDLTKRSPTQLASRSLDRRQGVISVPDINIYNSLLYVVELKVGTPPQTTFVQLDTGSSDLIVETPSSNICSVAGPNNPCTLFGSYTANASSTYGYIDHGFFVRYGGGDGATGDWASDIVSIGGATVKNVQFGIMYRSTVREGILGTGYTKIETRNTFLSYGEYDNFPVLLVKQGFIASRAYSLWTNDVNQSGGTLLFGGIDTGKFTGPLVTIPLVVSEFDGFIDVVDFTVSMQGVGATNSDGTASNFVSSPQNVLLDSGTTLTYLDPATVSKIWDFVGATPFSDNSSLAYLLCSVINSGKTINVNFKGITITVPMSQLVLPTNNPIYCYLGIAKQSPDLGFNIIGDTFLSSMYVVYDMDNYEISLAPTVFGSTTTNILQILAGPGGVPAKSSTLSRTSVSSTSSFRSSSTFSTTTPVGPFSSTSTGSSFTNSSSTGLLTSSSTSLSATIPVGPFSSTSTGSSFTNSSSTVLFSSSFPSVTSSAFSSIVLSSSSCVTSPSTFDLTSSSASSSSSPLPSSSSISTVISRSSNTYLSPSSFSSSSTGPGPIVTPVHGPKCSQNNCYRAMLHQEATGAAFCTSYLSSLSPPIPTKIGNPCSFLPSKLSSGCSCIVAATSINSFSETLPSTFATSKIAVP